jgi:PBSX family phage terminase large subunit
VNITDYISPNFYEVHNSLYNNTHTHYWLKGGRYSGKSSFISIEIILGIVRDAAKGLVSNAVCLRKVYSTCKDSVYSQLVWAISELGLFDKFQCTTNPTEIRYKPNGARILFRGAFREEDKQKIKSIKFPKGYPKFVWFEEAADFNGIDEITHILQSILRGGNIFSVFYSYNPPRSKRNWINEEVKRQYPDRLIHHSTMLDLPTKWVNKVQLIAAKQLKDKNIKKYEHQILGLVGDSDVEIFPNLEVRTITDDEILSFDFVYRGIDWSNATTPLVYAELGYNKSNNSVYIFHEFFGHGISNKLLIQHLNNRNLSELIIADLQDFKSIQELKNAGINIKACTKGAGSIAYGVHWMQNLDALIIDPVRCPNGRIQLESYEYQINPQGNLRDCWPSTGDDFADACRYALEPLINGNRRFILPG